MKIKLECRVNLYIVGIVDKLRYLISMVVLWLCYWDVEIYLFFCKVYEILEYFYLMWFMSKSIKCVILYMYYFNIIFISLYVWNNDGYVVWLVEWMIINVD